MSKSRNPLRLRFDYDIEFWTHVYRNRSLWKHSQRKQHHKDPNPIHLGRDYAGSKYYYGKVERTGPNTRGRVKTLMRRRMRHVAKQRLAREIQEELSEP